MTTDFPRIDFPENSISPTAKSQKGKGWELDWQYANLISGIQIGMIMPKKINPGPFVSKISFFAPVSLFLFFFLVFIITAIRGIKLHPMHYFFLGAAFFSFHLLMAYLADHADITLAFFISAAVSVFLVVSYMRIVAGARFAFIETALAQLVYLVFFSYAFFWEGYTGLAITICCIATLFVVMQFTARIDWEKQFSGK
jgi:inner membrane protein involved in colicin E2 resistance